MATPEYIWDLRTKIREIRRLLFEIPNTDEFRSRYNQCAQLLDCFERSVEQLTELKKGMKEQSNGK